MKKLRSSGEVSFADGNAASNEDLKISDSSADWTNAIADGSNDGLLAWVRSKATANTKVQLLTGATHNVVEAERDTLFIILSASINITVPSGLPLGFRFSVAMNGASYTWVGFVGTPPTLFLPQQVGAGTAIESTIDGCGIEFVQTAPDIWAIINGAGKWTLVAGPSYIFDGTPGGTEDNIVTLGPSGEIQDSGVPVALVPSEVRTSIPDVGGTIDTFEPNGDGSVVWEYYINYTENMRAGNIRATWNDTSSAVEVVQFQTADIGDTSDISFTVTHDGDNVNLDVVNSGSNAWNFLASRLVLELTP